MQYRIEELAEEAEVAVDTIRYYQRRKLLAPPVRRGRIGLYSEAHLQRLGQIRELSGRGFTLSQISELLSGDANKLLAELAAQSATDPALDRTELERLTGIGGPILDAIVDAGLIVASGEGDDQRFGTDAVEMLNAASKLIASGLGIDELAPLAMRHADHVERLVDDAIEIAKKNYGGDRKELAGLLARFVPVVSGLVGRHFEQTLLRRALDRFDDNGQAAGKVVVVSRKLSALYDPLALYAASRENWETGKGRQTPDASRLMQKSPRSESRGGDEGWQSSDAEHPAPESPHRESGFSGEGWRMLWISPQDNFSVVGLGVLESISPVGDGRFTACSAARAALRSQVSHFGDSNAPSPLLMGGFSFVCGDGDDLKGAGGENHSGEERSRGGPQTYRPSQQGSEENRSGEDQPKEDRPKEDRPKEDRPKKERLKAERIRGTLFGKARLGVGRPDWSEYPDALWVLPEITLINREDGSWLLAAAKLSDFDDEESAVKTTASRLESFEKSLPPAISTRPETAPGEISGTDPHYHTIVNEAVEAIGRGQLEKVVLARTHEVDDVDAVDVLHRLRHRYPKCAVFAVGIGSSQFLGASPECLVALEGNKVRTEAVAGTAQVDVPLSRAKAQTSGDATNRMLADNKTRAEHQFVVDDVIDRLEMLGLGQHHRGETEVLRLARVQHLRTPISAEVLDSTDGGTGGGVGAGDIDVFRVAGVLHPTPSVAGTPTEAALEWIAGAEEFDRGWYGVPVGWSDLDGNGELWVALRSALVKDRKAVLFSGAGVIAESDADEELHETSAKFRALLDVIEARHV